MVERGDVIRAATHEDIPRVVEMGRRFHNAAELYDIAPFDAGSVTDMVSTLIDNPMGGLFVAEGEGGLIGMTGGLLYPFYFNGDHLTGQEIFWWVEPEHRGVGSQLFDALEAWAKEAGAKSFSMIALEKLTPEILGRIYRRRGYRPSEHSYIRRL
jgi:GNAT superfamily N-acetyltransferase